MAASYTIFKANVLLKNLRTLPKAAHGTGDASYIDSREGFKTFTGWFRIAPLLSLNPIKNSNEYYNVLNTVLTLGIK